MTSSTCSILRRIAPFAAVVVISTSAHAQDPEAAALFAAGKDLASKGQWADACPKFEAAQRKEPALGTLMNLADCHEHVGLLFRSWGEWHLAYDQAKKNNDDARADLAKRRIDGIDPRLPRLKVAVNGKDSVDAVDLTVWRDDKQLDRAEFDTELPIDPGTRSITVRRGGSTLDTKTIDMKEKAHEVVTFDLEAIAKAHPAPVAPKQTTPGDTNKVVQTNTVVVNGAGGEQKPGTGKVIANVLLGVGLTGAVFGGAFMGVAALLGQKATDTDCWSKAGDNNFICSGTRVNNINTAAVLATVGQWVAIGGGVLAVTGIVLLIVLPKEKEKQQPQVSFAPVPGGAMFGFGGAF